MNGRYGLVVFCDRQIPDTWLRAGNAAESGTPVVILLRPGDVSLVQWPPVKKAAVCEHENTPDDALLAIVTAMIDAGIDEVRVMGNDRRDAKTYRAK